MLESLDTSRQSMGCQEPATFLGESIAAFALHPENNVNFAVLRFASQLHYLLGSRWVRFGLQTGTISRWRSPGRHIETQGLRFGLHDIAVAPTVATYHGVD